jgi:hypothetical protein
LNPTHYNFAKWRKKNSRISQLKIKLRNEAKWRKIFLCP